MTTFAPDVPQTLAHAAREHDLFAKVADAVRALETDARVAHVIVSSNYGEIVVIGDDYSHVALRVIA